MHCDSKKYDSQHRYYNAHACRYFRTYRQLAKHDMGELIHLRFDAHYCLNRVVDLDAVVVD